MGYPLNDQGKAKFASKDILEKIDVEVKKEEEAAKQRLMNAQALVKAFDTIGEIPVRSKVCVLIKYVQGATLP